jgi:hypothetical protein
MVTETPAIYASYIRPYMLAQREKGSLNWVFNIIEGRTEQEDVMYRETGPEGFLLLPDLNWDRSTMGSLHLLGLVERRDIWSVRDLKKGMAEWVTHMGEKMVDATTKLYPDVDKDELKLYIHCKFFFTLMIWKLFAKGLNRSTHILPFSHPHRTRLARGRQHASHGKSPRAGKHHLPARDHGWRRRGRHARRKPNVPSRRKE